MAFTWHQTRLTPKVVQKKERGNSSPDSAAYSQLGLHSSSSFFTCRAAQAPYLGPARLCPAHRCVLLP